MADKTLQCKDCGAEFVFTEGEQAFYAEKGFENEPARCRECRSNRKRQRDNGSAQPQREMFDAVCAQCGAQTKILNFVDQLHVIKDNLFPVPPLFRMIKEQSDTAWKEMYKVFNMGHRMELYIPEEVAGDLIRISEEFGVEARVIGRCEKAEARSLTIKSEYGVFTY